MFNYYKPLNFFWIVVVNESFWLTMYALVDMSHSRLRRM